VAYTAPSALGLNPSYTSIPNVIRAEVLKQNKKKHSALLACLVGYS